MVLSSSNDRKLTPPEYKENPSSSSDSTNRPRTHTNEHEHVPPSPNAIASHSQSNLPMEDLEEDLSNNYLTPDVPTAEPCGLHLLKDPLLGQAPAYPKRTLIRAAIESSSEKKLRLQDIYTAIRNRFEYYGSESSKDDKWKSSIRHNLSNNPHHEFIRVPKPPHLPGKGCFWAINPNPRRRVMKPRPKPRGRGGPQITRSREEGSDNGGSEPIVPTTPSDTKEQAKEGQQVAGPSRQPNHDSQLDWAVDNYPHSFPPAHSPPTFPPRNARVYPTPQPAPIHGQHEFYEESFQPSTSLAGSRNAMVGLDTMNNAQNAALDAYNQIAMGCNENYPYSLPHQALHPNSLDTSLFGYPFGTRYDVMPTIITHPQPLSEGLSSQLLGGMTQHPTIEIQTPGTGWDGAYELNPLAGEAPLTSIDLMRALRLTTFTGASSILYGNPSSLEVSPPDTRSPATPGSYVFNHLGGSTHYQPSPAYNTLSPNSIQPHSSQIRDFDSMYSPSGLTDSLAVPGSSFASPSLDLPLQTTLDHSFTMPRVTAGNQGAHQQHQFPLFPLSTPPYTVDPCTQQQFTSSLPPTYPLSNVHRHPHQRYRHAPYPDTHGGASGSVPRRGSGYQ